jgi:rhamnosyltransferase
MLEAISSQQTRHQVDVLIIDSGSVDGTVESVKAGGVRVVSIAPEEFGHGTTRNLGARLANGSVVVYLSQDAVPASVEWLENLVSPFEDPEVGAVYGRQLANPRTSPLMQFLHETFYPNRRIRRSSGYNDSFSFRDILFSNANSAIRKDVLRAVPFAEHLLMSEDQEFAVRLLRQGWAIVYEPDAAVWHSNEYSLRQFFRRNFDSAYSLRGLQSHGTIARIVLGLHYLIAELAYLARKRHWTYLPSAVGWEALRALAFVAGSNAERLPLTLRRRLSQRPEFWKDREGQVPMETASR